MLHDEYEACLMQQPVAETSGQSVRTVCQGATPKH